MIYQFYESVPASAVIWSKVRFTNVDVKFSGIKNFEKAIRLGDPLLDGYRCQIRSSYLNLSKEKRQKEIQKLREQGLKRRDREEDYPPYREKFHEKEARRTTPDQETKPRERPHERAYNREYERPEKVYERNYEKDYEKHYEREYQRDYERDHRKNYEGDYEKRYDRDYKRTYDSKYEPAYAGDYDESYGRAYERPYEREDYGKESYQVSKYRSEYDGEYSKDKNYHYERPPNKSEKYSHGQEYEEDYAYHKKQPEKRHQDYPPTYSEKTRTDRAEKPAYYQDHYHDKSHPEASRVYTKHRESASYANASSNYYSYQAERPGYGKKEGEPENQDPYHYRKNEYSAHHKERAAREHHPDKRYSKEEYEESRRYRKDDYNYDYYNPKHEYQGHGSSSFNYKEQPYSYTSSRREGKEEGAEKRHYREEKQSDSHHYPQHKGETGYKPSRYADGYGQTQPYGKTEPKYAKEVKEQPASYTSGQAKSSRKKEANEYQGYKKYDYNQDLGHYDYNQPQHNPKPEEQRIAQSTGLKKKAYDSTGGSGYVVRELVAQEPADKPRYQPQGPIMAESGFQKGLVTPSSDSQARVAASGSLEPFGHKNRSSQVEGTPYSSSKLPENYWGLAAKAALTDQRKPEYVPKPPKTREQPQEKYSYYGATANDIAQRYSEGKTEREEAAPVPNPASKNLGGDLRKISEEDNEADWGPRRFFNTAMMGTSTGNKDLSK